MILFPNAKINLGLRVTAIRPDGYHEIETVFYPIPMRDALEAVPTKTNKTIFTCSGLNIPGEAKSNLCLRAVGELKSAKERSKSPNLPPISGVFLHLHKMIPMGAGLGGGSSDGAATIKLLDRLFGLNLTVGAMELLAGKLGSDCPFFIQNKPVFANGRGDQFSPCNISLSGYHLIVVKPDVHVSTAEAYQMLTPQQPDRSLAEIITQPVEDWKGELVNDFEAPLSQKYPVIGEIRQKLYDSGAIYASMTGSGSAVYGIFKENPAMDNRFAGCFFWKGVLPSILAPVG